MNIWFTSDTHFSHAMLCEQGHRPFSNAADMDDALITAWNERVRPGDQVWHLGDWALGNRGRRFEPLDQLHGHIHLIPGNHDEPWPGSRDAHKHQRAWIEAGFASVQAFARRRIDGQQVLLSHLPYDGDHQDRDDDRLDQFRLPDRGLVLLHGHVHTAWKRRGRQINVGVDVRDWAPVHLEEIAAEVRETLAEQPQTIAGSQA